MDIRNEWDLADSDRKAEKELEVLKISGCGISAIGVKGSPSLTWVAHRIIEKGGTPEVTRL